MYRQKIPSSIIYSLFIFAAILIYSSLTSMDMSLDALYSLYLGDFSIGICSRLLIGEILSIFKDSFTREWINSFLQISTISILFFVSLYLGNAYASANKATKRPLLLFLFIFIAIPTSVSIYTGNFFSYADIFLLAILIITAFFGNNRFLSFTLPVIFAAGVLIHDCYILAYMAPCLGILAYNAFVTYKNKPWASSVFALSSVSCAAMSVYSVVFSTKTLKMTYPEMLEYLAQKGNCRISEVSGYLEYYLYFNDPEEITGAPYIENIWVFLKYVIAYACDGLSSREWFDLLYTIPVLVFIILIWAKCIKLSDGFFGKVPYMLFILTILPQILSTIISGDFMRFLAPMVITQIIYIFVCARQQDSALNTVLENLNHKKLCFAAFFLLLLFINIV